MVEASRLRAIDLLNEADLVLFVCDGKVGLLAEDRMLIKLLHKLKRPVIMVVNKIDHMRHKNNCMNLIKLVLKQLFQSQRNMGLV